VKALWLGALVAALSLSLPAHAQTFTAAPTSGPSPFSTTITWNIPTGKNCVASGGWSGSKAANGTQTFTNLIANVSYSLACDTDGPAAKGSAVLHWVAPTQNTDGSVLTDLKGFKLFSDITTPPTVQLTPLLGPNVLTFAYTNLDPGKYYFGAKAFNLKDADSDLSNIVSKTIPNTPTVVKWTGNIPITVLPPLPPLKPGAPVLTADP
jgi:hypothetical protein